MRRSLGVGALYRGQLVSGASSYAVADSAIEIEIDTRPDFQNRGLYPSWDAHGLRSVHLAEKLGYRLSHPYTVYLL